MYRYTIPFEHNSYASSVTEQPFKVPYYAALLRLLHDRPVGDAAPGSPSFGRQVLEDFWKGFQAFLDKQAWRETRLCVCPHNALIQTQRSDRGYIQVHFFAHLTVARVISVQSMFELLKSFTAVLDEFGVSHGRAAKAGLCAAEGLMIVSALVYANVPVLTITTYVGRTHHQTRPVIRCLGDHYCIADLH